MALVVIYPPLILVRTTPYGETLMAKRGLLN